MPGQTRRRGRPAPPPRPPFNGGPGNCPAKPDTRHRDDPAAAEPSMEGRAIARPNGPLTGWRGGLSGPFNGGPGNCPAKRVRWNGGIQWLAGLQWRAGQLPGQTVKRSARIVQTIQPSMEGRAIARPNLSVASIIDDLPWLSSMEGRAIARPNPRCTPSTCRSRPVFNGGPGNCPAKRASGERALGSAIRSSMEGRAIARPNDPVLGAPRPRGEIFNGGPGNCPAKLRGPA